MRRDRLAVLDRHQALAVACVGLLLAGFLAVDREPARA